MKNINATLLTLVVGLASCGGGGSGSSTSIPSTPQNRAPVVSSDLLARVQENVEGVVYVISAIDADGDALSFSISGSDGFAFNVDSINGEVTFVSAPDFEAPDDSNQDNTYELTVSASDGQTNVSVNIIVEVSNQLETAVSISGLFAPGSLIDDLSASGDITGDGLNEVAFSSDVAELADGGVVTPIPTSNPIGKVAILDGAAINALDGTTESFLDIPLESTLQIATGAESGQFGKSIDFGGDSDNDGLGDLLIGADLVRAGDFIGQAYFVPGSTLNQQLGNELQAEDITTLGGLSFFSNIDQRRVGLSVTFLGDFDDMGQADFMIGDDGVFNGGSAGTQFPGVTVVYGEELGSFLDATDIGDVAANGQGVSYRNPSGSFAPLSSYTQAGDLDGDGTSDFFVGVPTYSVSQGVLGAVYLVLGTSASRATNGRVELENIIGPGIGARITNEEIGKLGTNISTFSNLYEDGRQILGALQNDQNTEIGEKLYLVDSTAVLNTADGLVTTDEVNFAGGFGVTVTSDANFQFTSNIQQISAITDAGNNFLLFGLSGNTGGLYLIPGTAFSADLDGVVSIAEIISSGQAFEIMLGGLTSEPVIGAPGDISGDGIDDILVAATLDGQTQNSLFIISGRYIGAQWTDGQRSIDIASLLSR